MAPEQLAGKGASVQSDIYALGLVLYELSTGKKAFDAASLDDSKRKHAEETPTAPSTVAPGFDPAVERVILRCLEKDPAARPRRWRRWPRLFRAAIPWPRPSPPAKPLTRNGRRRGERAADRAEARPGAARHGRHRARAYRRPRRQDASSRRRGFAEIAGGLEARAREILASLGMADRPADSGGGLLRERLLRSLGERQRSVSRSLAARHRARCDRLRYRQSPTLLGPSAVLASPFPGPRVTDYDPPPAHAVGRPENDARRRGPAQVLSVEPRSSTSPGSCALARLGAALSRRGSRHDALHSGRAELEPERLRGHARRLGGPASRASRRDDARRSGGVPRRPVSFRWLGPWTQPVRDIFDPRSAGNRFAQLAWDGICFVLLFGGVWLVRGNLRSGRGDRRGAMRLATAAFLCELAAWAFGAHHVASSFEFEMIFTNGFTNALLFGAVSLGSGTSPSSPMRVGTGRTC